MVNPFELAAQKMAELGFFNFVIPFFITLAVFYGLLKKANFFSVGINAVIAFSVSFFIWGFWITTSVDIGGPLSKFFTQISLIILLGLFALVGASLFYPDFNKALEDAFRGGAFVWIVLTIFILIFFITSGLGNVLGVGGLLGSSAGVMVLVLFFLFLGVLIASLVGAGGGQ